MACGRHRSENLRSIIGYGIPHPGNGEMSRQCKCQYTRRVPVVLPLRAGSAKVLLMFWSYDTGNVLTPKENGK